MNIGIDLARIPMRDWEESIKAVSLDELQKMERTSAEAATIYARVSAYISRRITGGKHADAVKRQNKVARSVRQALGYTYADDSINF